MEWAENAPYEYLKVRPPEAVCSLKETLGLHFILELSLAGISMIRSSFGISNLEVYAYGRLIRLSDGAVVWLDKGCGVCDKCKYKDFSDLEKDNMQLIRDYYEKAVMHLINPSERRKPGGGVLHAGPFLRGLFPAGTHSSHN